MHQIRPRHLVQEIITNMRAGLNSMIWGGPGIGKSEIPQQIATQLNQKLLDFRANLFDPVDVRGVPYVVQLKESGRRYTRWAVPDVFPIVERDGEDGIFLIDELPTAPPATQNAFLQLLLTRRVGDYHMPDGWSIIAAGNRLTDSASVYQMPSPVRNRLAHYELEPHLDDWCDWAIKNNLDTSLISFMRYRPGLLYDFDADQYAFPTPRSWAFVDKKLKVNSSKKENDTLFYGVSALVGDGPAGEYLAFRKIANDLPDIDKLIANPSSYKTESDPAILYALTGALAARAEDSKMDNILKVTNKLPTEFQVVCVKGCISQERAVHKHPAVQNWITKNASVIL
mgnify:CR=1 FL=1